MRRALVLLAALLAGCPADPPAPVPPPPPPPSTAPARPAPTPTPAAKEPAVPPPALTREELLALDPDELMKAGLRGAAPGGLAPALAGEGALALHEQLRAASAPLEALDLCVVVLARAAERVKPGALVDEAAALELEKGLAVQSSGCAPLERWTRALARRAQTREDLDAAAAFLLKVKEIARLAAAKLPR